MSSIRVYDSMLQDPTVPQLLEILCSGWGG